MSVDYQSLAVKGVQALSPYQPGKPIEELARELGLNPSEIINWPAMRTRLGRVRKRYRPPEMPSMKCACTRTAMALI